MIVSVDSAVEILNNSGIVAIPTETVYGLAGVADDLVAIKKIYKAKGRPADNPLICHFHSYDQVLKYIFKIPDYAEILMKYFSPGPLSYLFNLPKDSPLKASTASLDSIICRIPNHEVALEILRKLNKPLAAPSANTSSKFSSTSAIMVESDLGTKIDGVVDGGESTIGLESTIIDCRKDHVIRILRPGFISAIQIRDRLKYYDFKIRVVNYRKRTLKQISPGEKYKHYAPETEIQMIKRFDYIIEKDNFAVLGSKKALAKAELLNNRKGRIEFICFGDSPEEIAHNLYQKLYELDKLGVNKGFLLKENYGNNKLNKVIQNRINKILA